MQLRLKRNGLIAAFTGTHLLSCLCLSFFKLQIRNCNCNWRKKNSKIKNWIIKNSRSFVNDTTLKKNMEITHLNQKLAQTIDEELMSEDVGYSVDQLMELVGLSISQIIYQEYNLKKYPNVIIICGPGNNGGDGLVAARHLKAYGYCVSVVYPKKNTKPLFQRLLNLLKHYNIEVLDEVSSENLAKKDLIVDAIFGFSFHGEPRSPFDNIIKNINDSKKPVVSIDVPSGLQIDLNNDVKNSLCVNSEMNISLMLPKEGVATYQKKHYLSGRFLPNSIIEKYNLKVPQFPDDSSFVLL